MWHTVVKQLIRLESHGDWSPRTGYAGPKILGHGHDCSIGRLPGLLLAWQEFLPLLTQWENSSRVFTWFIHSHTVSAAIVSISATPA